MDQGLIPRRYAKAVYKFALEKGRDKIMYDLCGHLVEQFVAAPELNNIMANPFVSVADKTKLLFAAAGADIDDRVFADMVKLLAQNNRLDCARDIAVAYRDIYRSENNIHRVKVTTAAPLDSQAEDRLKQIIARHLGGAQVEYNAEIKPDLIGGFTVNVDNERLDASVAGEINRLRQSLIKN